MKRYHLLTALILIMAMASSLLIPSAVAADTSWTSPTANAATTGGDGDGLEVTPENAYADGGGNAASMNCDCSGCSGDDSHLYYNFGFSIPAGATITGIEVRLDWNMDSNGGSDDNNMIVDLSWDGGSNWSSPQTDSSEPTSETTRYFGGSSDTWGHSWSATQLNDTNFRVRLECDADGYERDYYLDYVAVKVYYCTTTGCTGLINPSQNTTDTGGDNDGFENNPTYAYANGSNRAENNNGTGDRHRYWDYDFSSVPSNAAITGIQVRLDWWLDDTSGTNYIDVDLSWDGGNSWTSTKRASTERTSDGNPTDILGNACDTWGRTWNTSELSSSNFRVRLLCFSSSSTRDFRLDWVPVEVCYAGPAIHITKTATEASVAAGQTIHYTYQVTNETGQGNLTSVTVTDDKCSLLSGPSGDNGNSILEDGETWTYTCSYVTTCTDLNNGSVTNTATATGTVPGPIVVQVQDQDTETVTITAPTTLPNPALAECCGMDVVLVLDSSDSISNLNTIRNPAYAFVNALLPGTQSLVGVVEFDSQVVSPTVDLTNNITNINNRILGLSQTDGFFNELTNWQAALTEARMMLENAGGYSNDRNDIQHPDLIILISDGQPTTYGYPNSLGSYFGTEPDPPDINGAICAANAAKTSTGPIRIVYVDTDTDFTDAVQVAGSNTHPSNPIDITTDAIRSDPPGLTDVTAMANVLAAQANHCCTIVANAGEDVTICSGSSVQLDGSASGGTEPYAYSWAPSAGLDNPNIANPNASPSENTTYTLTVTDANLCSDTDDVLITVNPLPTVDAGDDLDICQYGDPINLDDTGESPSDGTWSGTGVSDSQFDPDDLIPGTYSIMYSYTNLDTGCYNSDNKTVTVNAAPDCEITADDAVCENSSGNLASVTETAGADYEWTIDNGSIDSDNTLSSITWSPDTDSTTTVTLNVTVTDNATGCSSACQKDVTINPLPECTITAPQTVCADSIDNAASVADAGNDATYEWSITNGNITGGQNTNSITWDAGSTSPVTLGINITDANGCSCTNDSVDVIVTPIPIASAVSNSPVCIGGIIQFTGGPGGMDSYSWTGPNGFSSNQQSPSITNASAAMAGIYTLIVTDGGCISDNATVSVSVLNCSGGGGIGGGEVGFGQTAPAVGATCPLALTVNMLGQITTAKMTSDGVLCEDCLAFDPLKQNSWEAKAGTKLTLEGNMVPQLIKVTQAGSSPPSGTAETIGSTYEINAYASLSGTTPSAISISPLFSMSSAYDPNELPKDTSEVIFAYYPNPNQGWLAMGSEGVIAEVGEARGTLNYFVPNTLLTKLAETAAKFEVSNLTVNPSQAQPAQQVTISVNVTNTGSTVGNYSVELKVNGITKSTKEVTVTAGTSLIVSFTTTEDAVGTYQVDIAGLKGEFVIAGSTGLNWLLIGGIIAAIILALGIWILVRWRRFSGY